VVEQCINQLVGRLGFGWLSDEGEFGGQLLYLGDGLETFENWQRTAPAESG
jgi:hypothetical protein